MPRPIFEVRCKSFHGRLGWLETERRSRKGNKFGHTTEVDYSRRRVLRYSQSRTSRCVSRTAREMVVV